MIWGPGFMNACCLPVINVSQSAVTNLVLAPHCQHAGLFHWCSNARKAGWISRDTVSSFPNGGEKFIKKVG